MLAAERAMLEHAHDQAKFAEAAQKLVLAEAELKRIDFLEQHRAQLAEREATAGKRAELEAAQHDACQAHRDAADIVEQIGPLIQALEAHVAQLRAAQVKIDRGVHFESYGVRDGLIPRVTITPKLAVNPDEAVRLLRVARDLVKLTPLSPRLAEMRASQR